MSEKELLELLGLKECAIYQLHKELDQTRAMLGEAQKRAALLQSELDAKQGELKVAGG